MKQQITDVMRDYTLQCTVSKQKKPSFSKRHQCCASRFKNLLVLHERRSMRRMALLRQLCPWQTMDGPGPSGCSNPGLTWCIYLQQPMDTINPSFTMVTSSDSQPRTTVSIFLYLLKGCKQTHYSGMIFEEQLISVPTPSDWSIKLARINLNRHR